MNPPAVFLGPTLPLCEARQLLPEATFIGPARQGDLYAALAHRPAALLLIDGVFDQELAVWHKEILWALARGVRVYGAASMGALRAAELVSFGMVGVGAIFEAFATGILEDDDEVALAHEAGSGGYRPLSEAMVNIRATLQRAEQAGVISAATAARLVRVGKTIFYPQRSLSAILETLGTLDTLDTLAANSAAHAESARLERWLAETPGARVDQKRLDAEAALRRVAADVPTFEKPQPPRFHFEYTEAWHEFRRQAALRGRPG